MDENVKGFMLFSDQKEYVDMLDTEQKAELLDALYVFSLGVEPEFTDKITRMAFLVIRQSIERAWKKSEQMKANGSKAKQNEANLSKAEQTEAKPSKVEQAQANGSKAKQNEAKSLNDTDTDTDTEREIKTHNARAREGVSSSPYTQEFESFWQTYPKKTGKDAAWRSWQAKKRERRLPPVPDLVAKVEQWKGTDQWQRDGGQYIPNPSTWINQARWQDEMPEEEKAHCPMAGLWEDD